MSNLQAQHDALTAGAGVAPMRQRTRLAKTGSDAIRFFNNYCTADVMTLASGDGTETFVTDVKGKVISHGFAFVGDGVLLYDTVSGQGEMLAAHFDRFLFSEDVTIADLSESESQFIVSGRESAPLLQKVFTGELPLEAIGNRAIMFGEIKVSVSHVPYTGADCFMISADLENLDAITSALADAGGVMCQAEALEVARVEAGFPLFGIDITDDNLPQEVDRNKLAISFTKGCYLGQETVARLDALGHVNRTLVGVKFAGETRPLPGDELTDSNGKKVGVVTSAVQSVKLGCPLALAYLRTDAQQPGATFSSPAGEAEKVNLPL